MFGAGAIGFFAVPYTIMVYPILYLVFPRLWSVAHKHGYVTSADFVRGRFGNRWLALASGLHRHPCDHALHRTAAGRHPGGDRRHGAGDQRAVRRPAADHRLRHPRRLHLHLRPARSGYDRHRQGPADLHHRHRCDHRGAAASRRLRQDVRRRPAGQAAARQAARRIARQLQRLCHTGARFGAGTVPVSALDHRHPEQHPARAWCAATPPRCRPIR